MQDKYSPSSSLARNEGPVEGSIRAWKRAFRVLGGPLLRLHHYRDVRTKVLHDAIILSERDRCNSHRSDCGQGLQ